MAGGMTIYRPQEDKSTVSRTEMFQRIVSALGGRIAEKIMLDDISTGASGDIEQATTLARSMVTRYGMSEALGPIAFDSSERSVFIGRDFSQTKSYSEKIAALIDDEVKKIFDEAMETCEKILTEHRDILEATAAYLLENETMDGDVFEFYCEHGRLPDEGELPSKTGSSWFGSVRQAEPAPSEEPTISESDTEAEHPEDEENPRSDDT
jgi:cell division protease FtsH